MGKKGSDDVYFLSPEEHKFVTRKLLMDARRDEVHPDLRGWNWSQPPIVTNARVKIGVSDIANLYCPTGRDLYLKRVGKVGFRANEAMVEGLFLHRVVSEVLTKSKIIIYGERDLTSAHYQEVMGHTDMEQEALRWGFTLDAPKGGNPPLTEAILERGRWIWAFETTRIAYRIDDIRSRYPYCEADAFVFLVLPVIVEQRLNGSFLGLSQNLAVDGYIFSEGMVVDLKFDPKEHEFHRLMTTGYAMVMESLYEYPIDLGCIVYVRFKHNQISIKREFHHVSDEFRQWFLEERDRKIRLIEDEADPGRADDCYQDCPYFDICHGGE